MKSSKITQNTEKSQNSRDDRLKAALKANMAKRKAQAKARSESVAKNIEAEKE